MTILAPGGPVPWFHDEAILDRIRDATPAERASARNVVWAVTADLYDYAELTDALGLNEGP